ncbi:MAG: hypothetical protein R3C16_02890 [Hyphomonadaceae bacterium]
MKPGNLGAFCNAVKEPKHGGVRAFLFDKLPRYADALRGIFNGSIDVEP